MRRLWVPTSIRDRSQSLIVLKGRPKKFRKPVSKKLRAGLQQKKRPRWRHFSITGHRSFVDELIARNLYKFTGVSKRRPRSLSRKINVTTSKRRKHGPFGFSAISVPRVASHSAKRSGQQNGSETLPRSELLDWTLQRVQQIKDEIRSSDLSPSALQLTLAIDVMLKDVASPARPFESASRLAEQNTALPPPSVAPQRLDRKTIETKSLEAAIGNAVKKGVQGCENFVGVIVKRTTPKSKFDTNWALRGVRFGNVDRGKADKAISLIVERMQREYRLSDD
jgi:hypothetical protein